MRALARLVLGLWLTLLCGCWPGDSPPDQKVLNAQLRGMTLREAGQQLGLKPEDCALFDEPLGVARAFSPNSQKAAWFTCGWLGKTACSARTEIGRSNR
jgi:hypothetical protein